MYSTVSRNYWQRMKKSKLNLWFFTALIGGIIYPPLVYLSVGHFPPLALIFMGLVLLGLRLLAMRDRTDLRFWQIAFLVVAITLIGLLFLDGPLAVKAYPVLISLAVAAVFGASLKYPPSMVERIARITEPDLAAEGILYTRRVTMVWVGFLLLNASISLLTAIYGSLAEWTLWNGLFSYLFMGLLFLGEFCLRRLIRPAK